MMLFLSLRGCHKLWHTRHLVHSLSSHDDERKSGNIGQQFEPTTQVFECEFNSQDLPTMAFNGVLLSYMFMFMLPILLVVDIFALMWRRGMDDSESLHFSLLSLT
jgi:hypothetical protein